MNGVLMGSDMHERLTVPGSAAPGLMLSALLVLGATFAPPVVREAATQNLAEQPSARPVATAKDIQRLQRLLKLLAKQNPARYVEVDPGAIDGALGAKTIRAIRNFQRIIGVSENPVVSQQLFAQILTAQAESPIVPPTIEPTDPAPRKERAARPGPHDSPRRRVARFAQLASLTDESRVPLEWDRLKKANPILLKDREPVVETADLGKRGIFYRILVGPFDELRLAKTFCAALRKNRQSCLIRKRMVHLPAAAAEPVAPVPASERTVVRDADQTDAPQPHPSVPGAAPAKGGTTDPGKPAEGNPIAPPGSQNAPTAPSPDRGAAVVMPAEQDAARITSEGATPSEPAVKPPAETALSPVPPASTPDQMRATVGRNTRPSVSGADISGASESGSDRAAAADKTSSTAVPPKTTLAQWLARVDRMTVQSYLGPTIAAAAGTCFGLFVLVWRQRRRKSMLLENMLIDPWSARETRDSDEQAEDPVPNDVLEELKIQFESPDLKECREIRDSFLAGVGELNGFAASGTDTGENAMLVNRKLNQLIATDPSKYRSIFFNWVFLNHAAGAVESSGYTLKRLDPRIQREFRLLASLFKIHLLELEARHHVRERLPNVFATLRQLEA